MSDDILSEKKFARSSSVAPKVVCVMENDFYFSDCPSESSSYIGNIQNNNDVDHYMEEEGIINNLEPLTPEKVRWFYKERKNWIPFCGYDSLRLETKYRELQFSKERTLTDEMPKEMIVVRGDLYEVNVEKREGSPIYWIAPEDEQNSFVIMRGTWFREGSWQPLESEEVSNRIEEEHMLYFIDSQYNELALHKSSKTEVIAQQITKQFHLNARSITVNGYHVEWYDESSVYFYMDSASHFIRHKLGLTKVGSRLSRGYKYDARIDDKLPDITHLVFVIHGIGQKMKGGDIVYQANKLRTLSRKVTKSFFPQLDDTNHRVEYLPVEWRKLLVLDGNTVELITPNRNKGFRNAVNSTALDVLYYSSPIYRPEMVESLRSELTRLYSMFCARSPYFEDKGGKVSILAHSLGAVLVYDILTNWSPAKIYEYLESLDNVNKDNEESVDPLNIFSELNGAKQNVHQLEMQVLSKAEQENSKRGQHKFREANFPSNFIHGKLWKTFPKLENFFCVGSPLAVFLALRGMKPQENTSIHQILSPELCHRIFNIFHPADPVVYRLEPLVNKVYSDIEPVRIHRLNQPVKTPYDNIPLRRSVRLNEEGKIVGRDAGTDYIVKDPSKNVVSLSLTERFARFIQRFIITKVDKDQVITPHLNNIELLLPTNDSKSKKTEKRKHKNLSKKSNLSKSKVQSSLIYNNHTQSSLEVPNFPKRVTTAFSSFRMPKVKEYNNMRKSLRGRPEIAVEYHNNYIENYWKSFRNEDKDDETLKGSGDETELSDDSVFETSLKPVEVASVTSESEANVPPIKELKIRIDYILPESRYESSYLSVLTSHSCYWNSGELCQFMLTQMFGHLGNSGNPC